MCGTLIGEQLFIAGGNRNGKPSNSFLRLDLTNLSVGWHELPEYPGDARTQAVCAGQRRGDDYRFYLWGGFAPSTEGNRQHFPQVVTVILPYLGDGCL